jgi:hypothetical protein
MIKKLLDTFVEEKIFCPSRCYTWAETRDHTGHYPTKDIFLKKITYIDGVIIYKCPGCGGKYSKEFLIAYEIHHDIKLFLKP